MIFIPYRSFLVRFASISEEFGPAMVRSYVCPAVKIGMASV